VKPQEWKWDGWALYLAAAVCLTPVLVPPGPGRTAIVDSVNLLALVPFAISLMLGSRTVRLPLLGPMLVILLGSVVATFNALNPGASIVTLVQDVYLYGWFVMLTNLMREHGDTRRLRLIWLLTGAVVALVGITQVLMRGSGSLLDVIKPKGFRAVGTFDQPDDLADYLVMSLFMALSLTEDVGRAIRWTAVAILGIGIVATKANGGILALLGGLVAWSLVRAWTKRASLQGLVAGALLSFAVIVFGVWLVVGVGFGSAQIHEIQSGSILGRMGHSSEGRTKIWASLWERYLQHPTGLGPGNSRWQPLRLEERERSTVAPTETFDSGADPFLSKETHNDYISYLVERGPVSLFFMLVLKALPFVLILRWWKQRSAAANGSVRGGAFAAALFGAWVASCINANTIETLHFRHIWLFLAVVCAMDPELALEETERERAGKPSLTAQSPAAMAT
jgi:O-antigen ligase